MKEKLGRFAVPRKTLERGDAFTVINHLLEIRNIYYNIEKDEFVYLATCQDFDLIGPDTEIPEYNFLFRNDIEVVKV